MEPSKDNIIQAYNVAKETGASSTCKVLETLYPEVDFIHIDNRPVTERIKTFEDACKALGEDHRFVRAYRAIEGITGLGADLYAYHKLRIITAALNEGWEPQFTKGEYRYYPLFSLYSKEQLDKAGNEWQQEHRITPVDNALFGGAALGFAYAYSCIAPSYPVADVGYRLYFKSSNLAEYAGKQFADIYLQFHFISK